MLQDTQSSKLDWTDSRLEFTNALNYVNSVFFSMPMPDEFKSSSCSICLLLLTLEMQW
jgi:hypothetical protein